MTEGNFFAHTNLGAVLLQKGRSEEAIAHFAEAVRLRPEWGKARKTLGEQLLRHGELEGALRQFQTALVLLPQDPAVHDFLGRALLALNRPGRLRPASPPRCASSPRSSAPASACGAPRP